MTKPNWTPITIRLGDIIPWTDNPRLSTKAQAQRLIDSELYWGQPLPFIVSPCKDGKYNLYDGHQRWSAWLTVYGEEHKVDAKMCDRFLSEDERLKYVMDFHVGAVGSIDWQKMASFPAPKLIEMGFNHDKLKELNNDANNVKELLNSEETTQDAEPQIDRAAELLEKWQVKSGDLWQIGEHRLICGDCTDAAVVARVMGGEKARMTITDPPWNVAIGKDSNPRHRQREGLQNDDMSDEDYSLFADAFISSIEQNCVGDVYCKVASEYMDIIGGIFKAKKFHWSATVIWVKDIFVLGRSKYHRRYEPLWYGWHSKSKSSFCDARDLDDVWEIKRPRISEEHPTMMPVELPERAIRNSSEAGDVVFDPFVGSGTTIVACENLQRVCYACDKEPKFVAVTLERMSQAFAGVEIRRLE
jgi:DNA modification methylase